MPSDRKESEPLSLAEKLLKAYEISNRSLDFSETKNQLPALQWVEEMMKRLKGNDLRAKSNGR